MFTPNTEILQSYGQNFSGLVGKPIEIWGQVQGWREGSGIRFLIAKQLKVLDAGSLANFRESAPDLMKLPAPAGNLFDSPKYLAWKVAGADRSSATGPASASQDRLGLVQTERKLTLAGVALPDEIRAARDRLANQQQAVALAIRTRDNAAAEQRMREFEDTLAVIEKFIAK